ncbi:hypothetical protein LSH36_201g01018 [Paralvinella palmiformis]|uniref:Metalloendopeptidase n=1 Tax=Paralvinella palmiformis TaxID=53620 RepID=A0AAD9JQX9_9ANNE|nr:hypothetical protein LSH36_201g01018 [Paralvinella palmiformis]
MERIWPNGVIPFVIGNRTTSYVRHNIIQAMGQWQRHTCIRFVNRTTEEDYIVFNPGPCGCCSFVGRRGGSQDVSLSPQCAVYGVVLHELGHVIGFWHEHSRPDRDRYIYILADNIMDGKLENFAKKPDFEINSLGQPYDYHSIMHYRRNTFSKNTKHTILPKVVGVNIGQRDRLSVGDILQANLLYNCPKPRCYEEFIKPRGSFSTPNYPMHYYKHHNCTWVIHALPGEEITLEFEDFDVEKAPNCSFDYIEIREGIDVTGNLIGRLCGQGVPGFFQSQTSMWIHFVSDNSFTRRGFLAHYYKKVIPYQKPNVLWPSRSRTNDLKTLDKPNSYRAKCNDYMSSMQGKLLTPLIPVWYHGKPVQCSWTIDGGKKTSRIVLDINLSESNQGKEQCAGAIYQRVTKVIRPKGFDFHGNGYRKGKLSNQSVKNYENEYKIERYANVPYNCLTSRRLVLNTSTVMVHWSSDLHPEFSASYMIDYNECQLGISRCQHYCHNTIEGYFCSCQKGYSLQYDGYRCQPKVIDVLDRCGGNLTSERGRIRAGTEPLDDCYYFVYLPSHSRIQLTFTKFNVPSFRAYNGSCLYAYVEILLGKTMHSKGRFCGRTKPPTITATTDQLTVKVHTNLKHFYLLPYFSAKYVTTRAQSSEGRCFYKLRARGSTISSPGFPNPYPANSFCVWRISARKGERIKMTFDLIDIEKTKVCSFDYVEVYDSKHVTGPVIGRYCGQIVPAPIISSGKHLRVMFVTDGTGSGAGFTAHFSVLKSND